MNRGDYALRPSGLSRVSPSQAKPAAAIALPVGVMALIRIQDFRCAYCRKAFLLNGDRRSVRAPTVEHVWPRKNGHTRVGNTLVVHRRCNEAKGDRAPTGCELLALEIVNAKRTPGCVGMSGAVA